MSNEQKIKQLDTLRGQLLKIEEVLEEHLTQDEFFEMCEANGTVGAYIKTVSKKLKSEI